MPRTGLSAAERQRQLDQQIIDAAAGRPPAGAAATPAAAARSTALPALESRPAFASTPEVAEAIDDSSFVVVRCPLHNNIGGTLPESGRSFRVTFTNGAARVHPDVARFLETIQGGYEVEWPAPTEATVVGVANTLSAPAE